MSWASDITLLNDAITKCTAFIIAREANTPFDELRRLETVAQTALTAAVTPLSASPQLPKLYHAS